MNGSDDAMAIRIQLPSGLVGPDVLEIVSEVISLTCITVLAVAMGSKTYGEQIKTVNYGRVLVILLYFLSWAFATTSVVLVSTNNNNMISCTLAMLTCDIFYAGSKVAIYAWLVERVHLVTAVKTTRLKTCEYRVHILLLCPYIIIFSLMLAFRNIYLEPDGKCTIGLQPVASVPLLVYDFIFNLYLTWLFMRPLMNVGRNSRMDWRRSRLYKLARRTLVASLVSLLVSFANVLVVVITQGHERGLVCLTMCTVDVTVNVVTVHWVTTSTSRKSKDSRQKADNRADNTATEIMTFDTGEPGSKSQKMIKNSPIPHMDLSHDTDSDSGRSVQTLNTSAKPLHRY
ncbi:hypothetical protein CLU79DRAFT_819962 [Phycomyces nitens]|nr:hypothetical protein CLU79DRAFT_819962 [Phycomyces nitens]